MDAPEPPAPDAITRLITWRELDDLDERLQRLEARLAQLEADMRCCKQGLASYFERANPAE